MSDTLEGWAYALDINVHGVHLAEHTYVRAPDNGPAYFDCWGGHRDPDHPSRKLTYGNGSYAVANCYRGPTLDGHKDTAYLVYGVTGVCHQTANRFLYSASGWLPENWVWVWKAKAYALSHTAYGDYGSDWLSFRDIRYGSCRAKHGGGLSKDESAGQQPGKESGLTAFYQGIEKADVSPLELVTGSFAALVREHLGAKFETRKLSELQRDLLQRKDQVAESDLKGEAFAHELNALFLEFQDRAATHLDPADYEALFGYPPGKRVLIVNPEVTAATRK